MDDSKVRERAEAHGNAVVAGDLRRAAADLTDDAKAQAPGVMKQIPQPASEAAIEEVRAEGDEYVARIRYSKGDESTTVASRWGERDGEPKIIDLRVE